ncbi:MAG: FAD:protein FMN transferase [Pseudobutyrivibrio sp.]|nr:FAD:protein FMN transferase [Pseudobutyrivibrio sp.]
MKKKLLSLIVLLSLTTFTGCASNGTALNSQSSNKEETATEDVFAMDTYMTVTAYGKNCQKAVDAAIDEIHRIDDMLSIANDSSEIAKLNASGSAFLSEETAELMARSLEIGESTEGDFNIAVYPVENLWGFYSGEYQVPSDEDLSEAMSLINLSDISFNEETREITLEKPGMAVDLGGIAKGYTSKVIMDIFDSYGCSGIVSLGGNIQATGTKPDGSSWKIAVRNPLDENSILGYVDTEGTAVVTSGGYERYFESDGKKYHHIIDPATGYPAENGIISSSIVTKDGTLADALSTAVFIMGLDDASEYWRNHSDEFDMIIYTEDDSLYVTSGIADEFVSDYDINIIE